MSTRTPNRRLLGVVLAGGASSRFGSPKWRAEVAGQSMGARAAAALGSGTAEVVALSTDPELTALGIEVRPDLEPGQGPLGAIRSALSWARELRLEGAFVLACDLPLVDATLVRAVISCWRDEDAVAPVGPRGVEPLCAVYATSLLPRVEALLVAGERSPQRLLEQVRVRPFPYELAKALSGVDDPFVNVNTKEGCAEAEAALTKRGRGTE